MKKIIAVVFALTLLVSLVSAGTAEETEAEDVSKVIDVSYFTEDKDYFSTEVSEDGDSAYIQTTVNAESRAFSTPYESGRYYSVVLPELMIENWSDESARVPYFRIWIRYRGTQALNIGAVSLVMDGTDYRFLDVSSPDWTATKEDGTEAQDVVLVLGRDQINATCFALLFAKAVDYVQAQMSDPAVATPDVKLVLHGDEDVETTFPAGFWSELAMFVIGLDSSGGFSFLATASGTPCMVTQ